LIEKADMRWHGDDAVAGRGWPLRIVAAQPAHPHAADKPLCMREKKRLQADLSRYSGSA